MNDPTPWPPEVPAGENPPPGAILDYFLAGDATTPVKIEILDSAGGVVRSYSSEDPVRTPDPAIDPVAYDRLCRQTPTLPDCGLPLYWPAPQQVISTRGGMHRVTWDMRFQPIGDAGGRGGAAVPGRTYPATNAPWAPPGSYTVRLTAGGKSYTQPLAVRLDPRVKIPAMDVALLTRLTREMYDGARAAREAYDQARGLAAQLDSAPGDTGALKARLAALAPPAAGGGGGRGGFGGGRGGGAPAAQTLDGVSAAMLAAAMAMQGADAAPTLREVAAANDARRQSVAVMAKWTALKSEAAAAIAKR